MWKCTRWETQINGKESAFLWAHQARISAASSSTWLPKARAALLITHFQKAFFVFHAYADLSVCELHGGVREGMLHVLFFFFLVLFIDNFTLEPTLICSLAFLWICYAALAAADKRLHNTSSKFCIIKTCDIHRTHKPSMNPANPMISFSRR